VTIATTFDFLMHAVLGWSATHLAQITGDPEIQQDAYKHRCDALNGLQQAIKGFSRDNSDAVLCASIVMAWQSSDA
jgi:Fungal specific transcription factor domain